jgi:hypothetical protein
MPKGITRRTQPKVEKKTKDLPELETVLCVEPENQAIKDTEHFMPMCKECNCFRANSRADNLCLNCHKAAAGYEFDEEKKSFVKIKSKGRK